MLSSPGKDMLSSPGKGLSLKPEPDAKSDLGLKAVSKHTGCQHQNICLFITNFKVNHNLCLVFNLAKSFFRTRQESRVIDRFNVTPSGANFLTTVTFSKSG